MTIKVIDAEKLMIRHANWGDPMVFQVPYQVLAIRIRRNKQQYLVEDDGYLKWWDAELFEIIDDSIPKGWVEIQYKRFHKFKNEKYDFKISTSYYYGFKSFLENQDFFFDIYENPKKAYAVYKKTEKKTGKTGDGSEKKTGDGSVS